jgi:hypothetical protein
MKHKINKDTTLAEILKVQGAEEILAKYNVPCLGCAFAKMEMEKLKIGDICDMYGISISDLLSDLNKITK